MDNQDKNNPKPWDASFSDDDPVRKYSRSANRKRTQRVSLVVGVLVTIILLLAFVPVYNYLQELNKPADATAVSSLAVDKTTTSESKVETKTKAQKKAAAKKAAAAKQASAAKASSQAAAEAKSKSEAAAKSSSEAAQNTAKLELSNGQMLFSWSKAHNTTPEAIYALNPGMNADNWSTYIGKEIKIK
ncbi:MAG: LysM domain-containing protein [Lactobacillaceae bacterium]|nr:LysM domain-containing protein [Lactobacillaceae bacterium]